MGLLPGLHVPTKDEIDAVLFGEGGTVAQKVLHDRFTGNGEGTDDEPIEPQQGDTGD